MADLIRQNGHLRFDHYMQLALYHPQYGYYSRGNQVFGSDGDFVTAPELTSLFGQTIAKALIPIQQQGLECIYEFGAGRGKLAGDLIAASSKNLKAYYIVELSGGLRNIQEQHLKSRLCPESFSKVFWLDQLPDEIKGIVLTNELLDSIPTRRFRWTAAGPEEGWVGFNEDENRLQMVFKPAEKDLAVAVTALEKLHGPWPEGYESEWSEQMPAWIRTVTSRLTGMALMFDYGHCAQEYYRANHTQGHLRAHSRHLAHDDFLIRTGEQDLTSHVDFTLAFEALNGAGGSLEGYVTQAAFLLDNGLLELANELPGLLDPTAGGAARQAIHTLTSEAAMGLSFKAMAWSRGFEPAECSLLANFRKSDLSHSL